jgi:ADP-heptose:LPS heptosyltransferase
MPETITIASGEVLPPHDYHCPLASLPAHFGTELETIPAPIPYLEARRERSEKWQTWLADLQGLRVGIAWAGSAADACDRDRSISFAVLEPLFALPGVSFVGLQKELREGDTALLRPHAGFLNYGPELRDFADTAAAISALDLIVSVDTALAHLAGALGRRLFLLLPYAANWRWLLDREDSPWYPSARLFRQSRIGDWGAVVDRVGAALAEAACAAPGFNP